MLTNQDRRRILEEVKTSGSNDIIAALRGQISQTPVEMPTPEPVEIPEQPSRPIRISQPQQPKSNLVDSTTSMPTQLAQEGGFKEFILENIEKPYQQGVVFTDRSLMRIEKLLKRQATKLKQKIKLPYDAYVKGDKFAKKLIESRKKFGPGPVALDLGEPKDAQAKVGILRSIPFISSMLSSIPAGKGSTLIDPETGIHQLYPEGQKWDMDYQDGGFNFSKKFDYSPEAIKERQKNKKINWENLELGASFAPYLGEVIDAKNTIKSLKKGKHGEAALHAAGFMIPFVPGGALVRGAKKLFGKTDELVPMKTTKVGEHTISKEGFDDMMKYQIPPAKYNTELLEPPKNVYRAVRNPIDPATGELDVLYQYGPVSNPTAGLTPITTKEIAEKTALELNPNVYTHKSNFNVGMSTSPNKAEIENYYAYRLKDAPGYYGGKKGINPHMKGKTKWDLSYNLNPNQKILSAKDYSRFMHRKGKMWSSQGTKPQANILEGLGYTGVKKFPDSDELQFLNPKKSLFLKRVKEIDNLKKGGIKKYQDGGLRDHMMSYMDFRGSDTTNVNLVMNAISQHESGNVDDKIQVSQKDDGTFYDGPGRGAYQFEIGDKKGANTAMNRTANFLASSANKTYFGSTKTIKDFTNIYDKYISSPSQDFSKLSRKDQDALFLGDKLYGGVERRDNFDKVLKNPTQENVFMYWLTDHKGKVNNKNVNALTKEEIQQERLKWNERTKSIFRP